jgi:hypothetical protein
VFKGDEWMRFNLITLTANRDFGIFPSSKKVLICAGQWRIAGKERQCGDLSSFGF